MNQIFLRYISAQLNGKLNFTSENASISNLSCYEDNFTDWRELTPQDEIYSRMHNIWKNVCSENFVWNDSVTINGNLYHKYITFGRGYVYAHMETNAPIDLVVCDNRLVGFMIPGRNESITVVIEGYEDCTNLALWKDSMASEAKYNVKCLEEQKVSMRDGVNLSTSVALPDTDKQEKFPCILIRTCYGKNVNRELWDRYAARGYAVVVQDTRGRDDSEGKWQPFVNETDDGDDTLNWIANQTWSDGNVGMLGGSYLGYVQWAAAASGNPHLKALVSQVTAGGPFVDLPRRGGCMQSAVMAWSFMVSGRQTDASLLERNDWTELLAHKPIKDIPSKALGKPIDFYDEWMKHPDNDEFWKKAEWSIHDEKINVPSLYISGWYDDDGPGTTQAWAINQNNHRENQKMILGPWLHKTNSARKIHTVSFAENALRYDLDLLYVLWFDHYLKGIENHIDERENVEYYQLGENIWKTDKKWPPENSVMTPFYCCGDNSISLEKPIMENKQSYQADPENPFPYIIDVSENENAIPGDYIDAEKREDVLLFTTKPMEKPLVIAGNLKADLYARSSCKDTDWVVRVTDVDENGHSIKLSDGFMRARYHKSFSSPELLTPGKTEKFEIEMTRIAHTVLPGHRLRIQIASGAGNFLFPNNNTGGDEFTAVDSTVAKQTVSLGGDNATCVYIPIIR